MSSQTVISRNPSTSQHVVNRNPMSSVISVISKQPTSPQNYLSFPITLPSGIVNSPNYFVSNKIFAKTISTQTVSNFPCPLISSGGRHCLSVVYRDDDDDDDEEEDVVDRVQALNHVDDKVSILAICLPSTCQKLFKKIITL